MHNISSATLHNHTYVCIDPSLSFREATSVAEPTVRQCGYCKSFTILKRESMVSSSKFECSVCRAQNQLGKKWQAFEDFEPIESIRVQKDKQLEKVRILALIDTTVSQEVLQGLQALKDILLQWEPIAELGLVLYDQGFRIVQLQEDGRIIELNSHVLPIVHSHFYPISETALSTFNSFVLHPWQASHSQNGSLLVSQLYDFLESNTIILWVGKMKENLPYAHHSSSHRIMTYCIVETPSLVNGLEFKESLRKMAQNNDQVLFLPRNQKDYLSKTHYQLYDWFAREPVLHWNISCRCSQKYPPEIITPKRSLLQTLHHPILLKIFPKTEDETYQLCIQFQKEKGKVQCLLIEFSYKSALLRDEARTQKYVVLYTIINGLPRGKEIYESPSKNSTELDVYGYLRDSSMIDMVQLKFRLWNINCVHVVWPWILREEGKIVFVYYTYGHYISHKMQNWTEKLQELQELCQVYYSTTYETLPLYYQDIIDSIQEDDESDISCAEKKVDNFRYYELKNLS